MLIPCSSHQFLELYQPWMQCVHVKLIQSCLTLCNPMDCSPPGSSVHGIFQARLLEWVAMPSSRGSSLSRDRTRVSCMGKQIPYHWRHLDSCSVGSLSVPRVCSWSSYHQLCVNLLFSPRTQFSQITFLTRFSRDILFTFLVLGKVFSASGSSSWLLKF